jgi:DNA-binding winged helix-turn-helix (wHTH) protein/Tol biopolymer transport system component
MGAKVTGNMGTESAENGSRLVHFATFEVDLRAGELRRDGRKVRVQEQPFQLLTVLLERPGDVVTRDELRAKLWPADTFVGFDHGLNAAVRRLRDALGDSAENPRFVETVARRGYRFIAPVSENGTAATPIPPAEVPESFLAGRVWWIATASVALLALGIGLGMLLTRKSIEPRVTERQLTANSSEHQVTAAAISPDGKYLAFADETGFYLRLIESGETHALWLPKTFDIRSVSWFPVGNHLVIAARTAPEQLSSLWDVSMFGGSPRKLIDEAAQPSVSPDGTRIAFLRGAPTNYKQECGCRELWLMQSDGQGPRVEVTDPEGLFGEVAWSTDGEHIAYPRVRFRGFERSAWLEVRDLAAGKSESIISNPRPGQVAAWTSQGRLIFSLLELPPNPNQSNLWSVRVDHNGHLDGAPVRVSSDSGYDGDISVSADGKRLATVKGTSQPDVYITDLEAHGTQLSDPRLLTFDERQDYPFSWTPDSKSVIFASDRDGTYHLFRQQINKPTPELLAGGNQPLTGPRLGPDGSFVLYLSQARLDEESDKVRIMRMPVAGGAPRLVLEGSGINNLQCGRLPSTTCIYSEIAADQITFFNFEPDTGKSQELSQFKIASEDYYNFHWSLSPDGRTLATAGGNEKEDDRILRLRSLEGRPTRDLALQGWVSINHVDWAADGQSLWINATSSAGVRTLLNLDLQDKVRPMMEDKRMTLGWAIPSPDGRHLAIWKASGSSNVWMLENF